MNNPKGSLIVKGKHLGIGTEWRDFYFIGPFRTQRIAERAFAKGKHIERLSDYQCKKQPKAGRGKL